MEEEHRLSTFENRVPKKIFGPKTDKIIAGWKRMHNVELQDLCSSRNIILVIKPKRQKWAGYVAHMVERRGAYKVLVGKPEGKRPLGRPRYRWKDNIKMDGSSRNRIKGHGQE
jgi:hypothetical protein